jgi:hypothetical protein
MKTYRTDQYLARLASYLVAVGKPFQFDGKFIEFTASEEFVPLLKSSDTVFRKVEFEIL